MKLASILGIGTLIALPFLAACAGTLEVEVESIPVDARFKWQPNPTPTAGKEYIYIVTGEGLDLLRGQPVKAYFRNADGQTLGEYIGTVPEEGDLVMPGPAATHHVDWATGEDISKLDMAPAPAVRLGGSQALASWRVVRSTVGVDGNIQEFAMHVLAPDIDAGLQIALSTADQALVQPKPAAVWSLGYLFEAELVGNEFRVTASQWQDPIDSFSIGLNGAYAGIREATAIQSAGWNAVLTSLPASALQLPGLFGGQAHNTVTLKVDSTHLQFTIDAKL